MDQDVLRAKWKHFRNEINDHWTELSSDDLDQINGRRDNLVVLLESRYGYARRRAEKEVACCNRVRGQASKSVLRRNKPQTHTDCADSINAVGVICGFI